MKQNIIESEKITVEDAIETLKALPSGSLIESGKLMVLVPSDTSPSNIENYEDEHVDAEEEIDPDENNVVLDSFLEGKAYSNQNYFKVLRDAPIDKILSMPIMTPYSNELRYEGRTLSADQVIMIDNIRRRNIHIAEAMSEVFRRSISGLLEYNTQCIARFGAETNNVIMCTIVDNNDKEL